MKHIFIFIILVFCSNQYIISQNQKTDSNFNYKYHSLIKDSLRIKDSLYIQNKLDSLEVFKIIERLNTSFNLIITNKHKDLYKLISLSKTEIKNNDFIQEKRKVNKNKDIMFFIFLSIFFLFALFGHFYKGYYANKLDKCILHPFKNINFNKSYGDSSLSNLLANILYIITLTTLITSLYVQHNSLNQNEIFFISLFILMVISIIYTIKYLTYIIIQWVNNDINYFTIILNYIFDLNKLLAIILFPITLLLILSNFKMIYSLMMNVLIIVLILFFVLRYYVFVYYLRKSNKLKFFSILLIIVAIEILPNIVILKFILKLLN